MPEAYSTRNSPLAAAAAAATAADTTAAAHTTSASAIPAAAATTAVGEVKFADLPPAKLRTASGDGVDPPSDENGMNDLVLSVSLVCRSVVWLSGCWVLWLRGHLLLGSWPFSLWDPLVSQ